MLTYLIIFIPLLLSSFTIKKAYKVEAVDTTAAGDSYTGALAVALSQDKNIEDAMDFASKVGALSVLKEGAQSSLPTLEDVKNFRG